jgi:hypothetical protein
MWNNDLEKIRVPQLITKFPAFCKTGKLRNYRVHKDKLLYPILSTSPVQLLRLVLLRFILILSSNLCVDLANIRDLRFTLTSLISVHIPRITDSLIFSL